LTRSTTIRVPAGPGDLQLLQAALAAASQANTLAMVEDPDLPCCSDCAGLELSEPAERDHQRRAVTVRGVREVLATGRGTCAELACIDTGAQNARLLRGESMTQAAASIQPDARGPGRHHVIVRKSDGTDLDPAREKGGPCKCS